jgi:hypothetical protein
MTTLPFVISLINITVTGGRLVRGFVVGAMCPFLVNAYILSHTVYWGVYWKDLRDPAQIFGFGADLVG